MIKGKGIKIISILSVLVSSVAVSLSFAGIDVKNQLSIWYNQKMRASSNTIEETTDSYKQNSNNKVVEEAKFKTDKTLFLMEQEMIQVSKTGEKSIDEYVDRQKTRLNQKQNILEQQELPTEFKQFVQQSNENINEELDKETIDFLHKFTSEQQVFDK
ncbi:hypothetical protein [Brevibacillus laterosporus]|uniref:Uncharacterized protein n=1 Tax=Brevibacillus laterosporus TaxID=1465 RepID=A0AAP8U4A4_BRELA|nr:hypothetical protein [Brevibacillus laterosporus]MED1666836.1 hypothetical protein [Brevibacillus laterosporus]MED1667924.1 hypothetical protein [Brevibacillus laterosporus]MED1719183.1 hypothetical protein [Brevibacillus laterosporus]PPA82216.1 hypothetical protein C4A76_22175 [Brevibacillus laterosporus]PPA93358.1 hypothetical protein C4A77_18525 [Brevibacillus laterosporus]